MIRENQLPATGYGQNGPTMPPASFVNAPPVELVANRAGSTFMEIIQRRWLMILMFVVVGGLAGYLYQTQRTPMYEAACRVVLERKQASLPLEMLSAFGGGPTTTDQLLLTHMEIICSPAVLASAAQDERLKTLTTFSGAADMVGVIMRGLSVNRPKAKDNVVIPGVLQINYRCEDGKEARVILEAVVAAYEKYVLKNESQSSSLTMSKLEEARKTLEAEIAEKRTSYEAFLSQAQVVSGTKGKAAPNGDAKTSGPVRYIRGDENDLVSLDLQQLVLLENRVRTLEQKRQETEAKLATLQSVEDKGGDFRAAVEMMIGRQIDHASALAMEYSSNIDMQVLQLQMQESELKKRYGPDHPEIDSIREKIRLLSDFDETKKKEAKEKIANRPRPMTRDFAKSYMDSLKIEIASDKEAERRLRAMISNIEPNVKNILNLQAEDKRYRDEIDSKQALLDAMIKRFEEIKLSRGDTALSVQVIAPPAESGEVTGLILRAVLAGAVIGFLLGFAAAYLGELADNGFRSPEEIRHTLGTPVLAHVPDVGDVRKDRKKGSKLHRSLVAVHMPKSRASEAFRTVRTGLYFSTREERHKAIQITSPDPSDGKTTLSCNLAVSIAQSGRRVLLIDADLRRPKIHKMFGLEESEAGLSSVLDGKSALDLVVRDVPEVENLWILPAGKPPSNPAEMLTKQSFEDLIEECKNQYDIVLVDTPPVLAVTDPTVVAPRMDGVILAIRLDKNSRPKAVRVVESLSQINCKILGVVVNGIGAGRGGYGGTYGYGYNGSYRYHPELHYGTSDYYDAYYGSEERKVVRQG